MLALGDADILMLQGEKTEMEMEATTMDTMCHAREAEYARGK